MLQAKKKSFSPSIDASYLNINDIFNNYYQYIRFYTFILDINFLTLPVIYTYYQPCFSYKV